MSVLLVHPDEELGGAIVERLIEDGDEVRVLVPSEGSWRTKGAFVATGDAMDADLVERACTNVRTIVFPFTDRKPHTSLLDAVVPAASRAGTDRVIVCTPAATDDLVRLLDASTSSYAVLITGRRGFLPGRSVDPERVAAAVSAADDIAGEPKLVVDLGTEEGWQLLGGHT